MAFDGINCRMTAISRTMRDMATNKGRAISDVLNDHCRIVGCDFEKTATMLCELHPDEWFAFNAKKCSRQYVTGNTSSLFGPETLFPLPLPIHFSHEPWEYLPRGI